jgi:hypothetical protein
LLVLVSWKETRRQPAYLPPICGLTLKSDDSFQEPVASPEISPTDLGLRPFLA